MRAGIKCGHCDRRHATVAQVRLCAQQALEAKRRRELEEQERDLAMERTFDTMIQQKEREEDAAVAAYKAHRDQALAGMSRTRRQRPW